MGNVDFSPEINLLKKKWSVLSLMIKKRIGARVNSRLIARRAAKCGVERPGSWTLREALNARDKVEAEWAEKKPRSKEMRLTFLWEKANCIDPTKSKESKAAMRLIQSERARENSRKIQKVLEKQRCNSVSKVKDPEENTHTRAKQVVKTIMEVNSERFRQMEQTAMRKEPLRTLLGIGDTKFVRQILGGTAEIPGESSERVRKFIEFFKKKHPSDR